MFKTMWLLGLLGGGLVVAFWTIVWQFNVLRHRGLGLVHFVYFTVLPVMLYLVYKFVISSYPETTISELKQNLTKTFFDSSIIFVIIICLLAFGGFYLGFIQSRAYNQNRIGNIFSLPILTLAIPIVIQYTPWAFFKLQALLPCFTLAFILWFFGGLSILMDALASSIEKILDKS